jgi:hypothetical protein
LYLCWWPPLYCSFVPLLNSLARHVLCHWSGICRSNFWIAYSDVWVCSLLQYKYFEG